MNTKQKKLLLFVTECMCETRARCWKNSFSTKVHDGKLITLQEVVAVMDLLHNIPEEIARDNFDEQRFLIYLKEFDKKHPWIFCDKIYRMYRRRVGY
jgi:hypothetical protein